MKHSTHIFACLLAVSFSAASLAGPVYACGEGAAIFEDPLTEIDFSWGLAATDESRSFGPEGLSWNLKPNVAWIALNNASLYEDVEVCVDVSMNYPEKSAGYVGLAFWGVDKQNTFTVDLFPYDGAFAVYRLQNNKLLTQVAWTENAVIKKEPGAINSLSVKLKGNQAVVSINDAEVVKFRGIPPKGGGLAGLDMGTHTDDSAETKFTLANFQVRELVE